MEDFPAKKYPPMCSMKFECLVGGKVTAYLKTSKCARGARGKARPVPSHLLSERVTFLFLIFSSRTYAIPHNNPESARISALLSVPRARRALLYITIFLSRTMRTSHPLYVLSCQFILVLVFLAWISQDRSFPRPLHYTRVYALVRANIECAVERERERESSIGTRMRGRISVLPRCSYIAVGGKQTACFSPFFFRHAECYYKCKYISRSIFHTQ